MKGGEKMKENEKSENIDIKRSGNIILRKSKNCFWVVSLPFFEINKQFSDFKKANDFFNKII